VRVTGASNTLIAAICKVVPDDWVLGFVGGRAKQFRRL
jgi:hypothetical protein